MRSIDEVNEMLNDIADEIPQAFFQRLNGGIILSPEAPLHEKDRDGTLHIMGQYHNNTAMGRYIVLYYGSFNAVYAHTSDETLRHQLKKVLLHEFTHHIESLAGERGLEIKDAKQIAKYLQSRRQEE